MASHISPIRFAAGFDPITQDQWVELATASLGRGTLDSLVTTTDDGIPIEPLYVNGGRTDQAGFPGASPYIRGTTAAGETENSWGIRALVTDNGVAAANASVLDELQQGATSILLDPLSIGIQSFQELVDVLEGVHLEMAPISLLPSPVVPAAGWLADLWEMRDIPFADRAGSLGVDPVAVAALYGGKPDLSVLVPAVASVAKAPRVHPLTVDATVWAEAGASESWELACSLATAVVYLRLLESEGLPVEEAFSALTFVYSSDTDQFRTIAKFRAARRLWDRISEVCGVENRGQHQTAVSSSAIMTRHDPWVNLLRGTVAAFSAGLGGSNAVTVRPFDAAIGQPNEFGRRTARNTQLLLREESGLARLVDPAGGSWFVESFTESMAEAAWERFRAIEANGGMLDALSSGMIESEVGATCAAKIVRLSNGTDSLIGVSEFPDIDALPLQRSPRSSIAEGPFAPIRFAESFEVLRDAGVAANALVRLMALGPVTEHSARSRFVVNLLSVGGIRTTKDKGPAIAVICGSDERYLAEVVDVVSFLKDEGVTRILLVGDPGDFESVWREAGVDNFVGLDSGTLEVLRYVLADLGVIR